MQINTIFLVVLSIQAAAASARAECIAPSVQVKDVRVLACERPEPYVRSGAERKLAQYKHQGLSPEAFARQVLADAEGSVAVLRVKREVTLEPLNAAESRRLGAGWVPVPAGWLQVDRTERVWWNARRAGACADLLGVHTLRVFVTVPCCDEAPPTNVSCVADLDEGSPIPDWAAALLDGRKQRD